jgi:hypothetical protein
MTPIRERKNTDINAKRRVSNEEELVDAGKYKAQLRLSTQARRVARELMRSSWDPVLVTGEWTSAYRVFFEQRSHKINVGGRSCRENCSTVHVMS